MSEPVAAASSTPPSYADRALLRLRRLASGNGLEPAAVVVHEAKESTVVLRGAMDVTPSTDSETLTYAGRPRGKGIKAVGSFAEIPDAVAAYKQAFRDSKDWIDETRQELLTHESKGWGLESAKVTLPKKAAAFAATQMCPGCNGQKLITCEQCNGVGTIMCVQCQGQGREPCYHCNGRGEEPQQPGQRCHLCQGTRFAPCRICQMQKMVPCPTCLGKRGTPCQTCQGTGLVTQEVRVTCGAQTHFKMLSEDLPSGLRRGLDRIGPAHLGLGHADIVAQPAVIDKDEPPPEGAPIPLLTYAATLPYAELRISFGHKAGVIGVVGKRGVITGVPNFLDSSLAPWREKLQQAARGEGPLEAALEARAIKELLALSVAGKATLREARRLYPYGISNEGLTGLMVELRAALNRATQNLRGAAAGAAALAAVGFFHLYSQSGLGVRTSFQSGMMAGAAVDAAALAGGCALAWAVLNFATRVALQRRFPKMPFALVQKTGKIGYALMGGVCVLYALMLFMAPMRPLWLATLLTR